MGMLGVQLVDIVQNWKLIVKPVRTLLALVLVIVLTLVIPLQQQLEQSGRPVDGHPHRPHPGSQGV